MYAKIFNQILDSSIAEDYQTRHIFMDLCILADKEGFLDKTLESISRRLNIPQPLIAAAIDKLCQPDPFSRSKEHDGKRLIPVDLERGWGWQIVNYPYYRDLKDEDAKREYHKTYMQKWRADQKSREGALNPVKDVSASERSEDIHIHPHIHPHPQTDVPPLSPPFQPEKLLTPVPKKPKRADIARAVDELLIPDCLNTAAFLEAWTAWKEERAINKHPLSIRAAKSQLIHLANIGERLAIDTIHKSIDAGYQGLFPPKIPRRVAERAQEGAHDPAFVPEKLDPNNPEHKKLINEHDKLMEETGI